MCKPVAAVTNGRANFSHLTIVGKYVELEDSYKSLNEALIHGGFANNVKVNFRWVESEDLMTDNHWEDRLRDLDAILVPGGFGKRGIRATRSMLMDPTTTIRTGFVMGIE